MEIMKILSVSNVIYEKYLPFHRTTVFGGTMEIMKILGVNSGIKDDILLS